MVFSVQDGLCSTISWTESELKERLGKLENANANTHYLFKNLKTVEKSSCLGVLYNLFCCTCCNEDEGILEAGDSLSVLKAKVMTSNSLALEGLFNRAVANYKRNFNNSFVEPIVDLNVLNPVPRQPTSPKPMVADIRRGETDTPHPSLFTNEAHTPVVAGKPVTTDPFGNLRSTPGQSNRRIITIAPKS